MFSVVADGTVPPPVFFTAVVLVTSGVCVYEIGGKSHKSSDKVDSSDDESEKLNVTAHAERNGQGYMSIEANIY
jgi:hypothetical protein